MIKCIVNIEYFLIFWEGGWYFWPLKGLGHERFHQPVTACYNPYHVTPPTTPPTYKNMQSDTSVILIHVRKQWLSKLLHFQLYTDKSYLYLKHERAHLITSLPVLFMCLIAGPYNMTLAKYSSLTLECSPSLHRYVFQQKQSTKLYSGRKALSRVNFLSKTMFTSWIETEFSTQVFKFQIL